MQSDAPAFRPTPVARNRNVDRSLARLEESPEAGSGAVAQGGAPTFDDRHRRRTRLVVTAIA